jgi:hypothetical protein
LHTQYIFGNILYAFLATAQSEEDLIRAIRI